MAGGYTHITMVNEASARPKMEAFDIPTDAVRACGRWLKYCELGVVSPDLPYLDLLHSGSATPWADTMHYQQTDGVIRSVIEELRNFSGSQDEKEKGLAWLLGYTAHVVMDCTIHPVVNLRVGPYAANKTEHRNCEMSQDVFIFDRLGLGVTTSEHLAGGISACVGPDGQLDATINRLWMGALAKVYPERFAAGAPNPQAWHKGFTEIVNASADTAGVVHGVLYAIGRHVAPNAGAFYPAWKDIDYTYIESLRTPSGTMHFNDIFDKAREHVCKTWRVVANGALGRDEEYKSVLAHCDLDTGMDAAGRMVFWDGAQK